MTGQRVSGSLRATVGADGTASATYSGPTGVRWSVGLMAASGNSQARPELRVSRNGVMFAATSNANADTSTGDAVVMHSGDVLRADWSRATPGAVMFLVVEGE